MERPSISSGFSQHSFLANPCKINPVLILLLLYLGITMTLRGVVFCAFRGRPRQQPRLRRRNGRRRLGDTRLAETTEEARNLPESGDEHHAGVAIPASNGELPNGHRRTSRYCSRPILSIHSYIFIFRFLFYFISNIFIQGNTFRQIYLYRVTLSDKYIYTG